MKKLLLFAAFIVAMTARGQSTNVPLTKFETQYHLPDATHIRGMAVVPEAETLFLEVRAEKLTTMPRSNSVYAVSLRGRASNYTDVDYIDDDELDGLIRGIKVISQAGHSITPMDDFEVTYRTRSGFSITKSSSGNNVIIIVRSGRGNDQRVQVENYVLDDLASAISAAKAKLDALR